LFIDLFTDYLICCPFWIYIFICITCTLYSLRCMFYYSLGLRLAVLIVYILYITNIPFCFAFQLVCVFCSINNECLLCNKVKTMHAFCCLVHLSKYITDHLYAKEVGDQLANSEILKIYCCPQIYFIYTVYASYVVRYMWPIIPHSLKMEL